MTYASEYKFAGRQQEHCKLPEIVKLFSTAKAHLQYPRLRISINNIAFTIYPAAADSRNRGWLYVKRGEQYLGKIAPDGGYYGAPEFKTELAQLNDDPFGMATMYGKRTGICCFCGQGLSDARSVAVGYGPICAGHWGMPWGDDKVDPYVSLEDLNVIGLSDPSTETIVNEILANDKVPMTAEQMASCIMHELEEILDHALNPGIRLRFTHEIKLLLENHPLINSN